MAKYTEARRRANEKYNAKAYESVTLRVKAGEKEQLQQHAEKMGESVNAFINRAIVEAMERDNARA